MYIARELKLRPVNVTVPSVGFGSSGHSRSVDDIEFLDIVIANVRI